MTTNLGSVVDIINSFLETALSPAPIIQPPIILTGGPLKPGLNSRQITSRIISRKSEAGAPTGILPSGAPSVDEKMERIRVEEIINAIISEARITVVIPPGTPVTTIGANAGGPVLSQGVTINLTQGYGVIQ
jgi:hypothetical protein